jgi:hypothetical protein
MPGQTAIQVVYDYESSPLEVRFVSELTRDGEQVFRGANLRELLRAVCHAHANLLIHLYDVRRDRAAGRNSPRKR